MCIRDRAEIAQLAERTGYDYLWLADERFFREVYACLTLCALRTRRIRLGPCVTDPYSRHPALTAMAIATLDEISGQRAVLGLSLIHISEPTRLLSISYAVFCLKKKTTLLS